MHTAIDRRWIIELGSWESGQSAALRGEQGRGGGVPGEVCRGREGGGRRGGLQR